MCMVLFLAALFFCGVIYNLFRGDMENVKIGSIFVLVLLSIAAILGREENLTRKFLIFLVSNEEVLQQGGSVEWRGKIVSLDSEVTQFYACVGLLITAVKVPSRYFVRAGYKTFFVGAIYSLIALVFGWWALPDGPISTIHSLYKNLRGGEKKRISQLLAEIDRDELKEHDDQTPHLLTLAKEPPPKDA